MANSCAPLARKKVAEVAASLRLSPTTIQ